MQPIPEQAGGRALDAGGESAAVQGGKIYYVADVSYYTVAEDTCRDGRPCGQTSSVVACPKAPTTSLGRCAERF